MITETDWELGLPPRLVEVEAYILGQVRQGFIDSYGFMFSDLKNAHPLQATSCDLDRVKAWRYKPTQFQMNVETAARLSNRIWSNFDLMLMHRRSMGYFANDGWR